MIASYSVGITPTELKKERRDHLYPHTITNGLSLWANHPKDQPSLFSRDQLKGKPISMRGDELPLLTVKQSFWAFLMGLRPPCSYPSTRTIILKGHPMTLSEAYSVHFSWGRTYLRFSGPLQCQQHRLSSFFVNRLCLIVPYLTGFVKNYFTQQPSTYLSNPAPRPSRPR